jgi:K+-sensing histidine kinase KdpD
LLNKASSPIFHLWRHRKNLVDLRRCSKNLAHLRLVDWFRPRYDPLKAEMAKGGSQMGIVTRALPAVVSVTVVAAVTAIVWCVRLTGASLPDPAFFYVLPIIVIAIVYGSGPALLGVLAALVCADFFLYDPLYSFDIVTRVEAGDLTCFSLLAVIGVKCATELFRPSAKLPAARSYSATRLYLGRR